MLLKNDLHNASQQRLKTVCYILCQTCFLVVVMNLKPLMSVFILF